MCDTNKTLNEKVVVITGASSGLGLEAAKNLANRGAKIIMGSRNETKLRNARDEIIAATGNRNVVYKIVDMASLKSVRSFANEVTMENTVDVLINNAGAYGLSDRLTTDDLSLTMQTNFFGTFLLTFLLLPKLRASAPSRIITGVAINMHIGEIDFDNWNDIGRYNALIRSSNSKLALSLFNAELDKRLKNTHVTANTFDPFVVPDTNSLENLPEISMRFVRFLFTIFGQKKEEIGKQIGYLATAPEMEKVSGKNYMFCREFKNPHETQDVYLTKRLWQETKKVVKITKEEDWEAANEPGALFGRKKYVF